MMNSRHGNLRTIITIVFNMYSLKVQGMVRKDLKVKQTFGSLSLKNT
jgi:hypothetical protein